MEQLLLWEEPSPDLDIFLKKIKKIDNLLDKIGRSVLGGLSEAKGEADSISDLDPTEKTVIGIKVENHIRKNLPFDKGVDCDCSFKGDEFDVKTTVTVKSPNWWVSPKQVRNKSILLLIKLNDVKFSCGVIKVDDSVMNKGENRDKKRTINKFGKEKIVWMCVDKEYGDQDPNQK